jgi:hypothetical protein
MYHNSTDPKKGWDGTFNGVMQDLGVYNYVLVVTATDGTEKVYKGNVTMLR